MILKLHRSLSGVTRLRLADSFLCVGNVRNVQR